MLVRRGILSSGSGLHRGATTSAPSQLCTASYQRTMASTMARTIPVHHGEVRPDRRSSTPAGAMRSQSCPLQQRGALLGIVTMAAPPAAMQRLPRLSSLASITSFCMAPSGHEVATIGARFRGCPKEYSARPIRRIHGSASSSSSSSSSTPASPPALLTDTEALSDFIAAGPLLPKVGLRAADVAGNIQEWARLGDELAKQLKFDTAQGLTDSQQRRIYHYYLPVFFWCLRQLQQHQQQQRQPNGEVTPLVIGISAPQGCGKTTVVESLEHLFAVIGKNAASISIDDFYLRYEEQVALAASNPGNKLLELRGNAGSHDLGLAEKTVQELKKATRAGVTVPLPRYDKSAYQGRGDRAPEEKWPMAQGPVDLVLLEGWMLGFKPLPSDDVAAALDPQLAAVNQNLANYAALHGSVDAWVIIQVATPDWVFQWRLEAEVRMRESGKPGMTDEQVADFVSRYIPAYQAYLKELYEAEPNSADPARVLRISVDRTRNPLG